MGMWTKILIGALLTALIGWLSYSAICQADGASRSNGESAAVADGSDDEAAVAAAVDPVVAEKVASCQSDVDSVLASKTMEFRSGSAYISPAIAATAKREQIYLDQRFSDHAPLIIDYDFTL